MSDGMQRYQVGLHFFKQICGISQCSAKVAPVPGSIHTQVVTHLVPQRSIQIAFLSQVCMLRLVNSRVK